MRKVSVTLASLLLVMVALTGVAHADEEPRSIGDCVMAVIADGDTGGVCDAVSFTKDNIIDGPEERIVKKELHWDDWYGWTERALEVQYRFPLGEINLGPGHPVVQVWTDWLLESELGYDLFDDWYRSQPNPFPSSVTLAKTRTYIGSGTVRLLNPGSNHPMYLVTVTVEHLNKDY